MGESGRVDFYYNDLHGLEKSLRKISEMKEMTEAEEEQYFYTSVVFSKGVEKLRMDFYCMFYKMKFFLFKRQFQKVSRLVEEYVLLREVYLFLLINEAEKYDEKDERKEKIM